MARWSVRASAALLASIFIAACAPTPAVERGAGPATFADENPPRLSDWAQVIIDDGRLRLNDGVTAYDLATPLFSDYALKLRTVWTPGEPADFNPTDTFEFPVGAVITKTFYYPRAEDGEGVLISDAGPSVVDMAAGGGVALDSYRLMETRVLVRRESGWAALPYVWNDDQTDAVLKRTGDIKKLTLHRANGRQEDFAYVAPNANQCAGCHATNATTRAVQPIGPKARHLDVVLSDGAHQLDHWREKGLLTGYPDADGANGFVANADWRDPTASLDARARAYLDINCSHCHNAVGPADTSGLDLEPGAEGPALGLCKSPIAAGRGAGGRPFDIVPGQPDDSILLYRMETIDPGEMMPELGRALAHAEGVALIREWIASLDGRCET